MSITIPNYRLFSGTTLTVPASETWIINNVEFAAGSGANNITMIATINGNSFLLWGHNHFTLAASDNIIANCVGNSFGGSFILKTGDTLVRSTGSFKAYYWILETDFPGTDTSFIPNLRYSQITASGNITVPGGETWVVTVCCCGVDGTDNSGGKAWTVSGGFTQNSNTIITVNGTGTTPLAATTYILYARSLINNTIILQAGDTINFTGTVLTTPTRASLDVGYYKLGVDL